MVKSEVFILKDRFCVMCGKVIPGDRSKLSVTCSKECSADRKDYNRARADQRVCKYCQRPSTPEERKRFQAWRRYEKKNPPPPEALAEHERHPQPELEVEDAD
jgi:predicted nucleic acid-binding Zn ribbon protein